MHSVRLKTLPHLQSFIRFTLLSCWEYPHFLPQTARTGNPHPCIDGSSWLRIQNGLIARLFVKELDF